MGNTGEKIRGRRAAAEEIPERLRSWDLTKSLTKRSLRMARREGSRGIPDVTAARVGETAGLRSVKDTVADAFHKLSGQASEQFGPDGAFIMGALQRLASVRDAISPNELRDQDTRVAIRAEIAEAERRGDQLQSRLDRLLDSAAASGNALVGQYVSALIGSHPHSNWLKRRFAYSPIVVPAADRDFGLGQVKEAIRQLDAGVPPDRASGSPLSQLPTQRSPADSTYHEGARD